MFLIDLCSPFVKHPHISPVLSRSCSPKGRSITWGSYSLLVVLFRFLFVKWLTPEMCTFSMFHFGHILFSVGWTAEKRESVAKSYPGAEWHTLMKNPLAHVLLLSCQSSLESSLHPNRPLSLIFPTLVQLAWPHPNRPLSLIFPTSVQLAWLHPNKCFSTLPSIVRGCSGFEHPVQQSFRS